MPLWLIPSQQGYDCGKEYTASPCPPESAADSALLCLRHHCRPHGRRHHPHHHVIHAGSSFSLPASSAVDLGEEPSSVIFSEVDFAFQPQFKAHDYVITRVQHYLYCSVSH